MASATLCGVSPPESMKGTDGSSALSNVQSKDAPSPPGRSAPLGGLASTRMRSATSMKSAIWATSSADPIGRAFMISTPASARMASTRCGVSGPWSWIQSGPRAAISATQLLSGLTNTTQVSMRPRACEMRSAICSTEAWRGERWKCMKPTMSAPASMAVSRMSGVLMPQILMTRGSAIVSLSAAPGDHRHRPGGPSRPGLGCGAAFPARH
ncbi:hypothetical protein D3C72_1777770 [compost metagenome]